MENLGKGDIFDLDNESFTASETPQGDGNRFKPDPKEAKDGVYKAIVRFLPNWKDPNNKSKIQKHYVWLGDPASGDEFSVDCPSTVGKKSILKDTFWKLRNSDSAKDQELSKKFSRKTAFYSIVQVVDDKVNPDNNGKLMYWNFGMKVNDKIESELKPEVGVPNNPYSLFEGKSFYVEVAEKYGWNNYDGCKFVGDKAPMEIDGKPIEKTPESMETVRTFLESNSPDLERFEYKEWDDDTHARVISVIKNSIPDGRLVEQILSTNNSSSDAPVSAQTESKVKPETKASTETKVTEPVTETETKVEASESTTETAEESVPETVMTEGVSNKEESAATSEAGDNPQSLDDLYADL